MPDPALCRANTFAAAFAAPYYAQYTRLQCLVQTPAFCRAGFSTARAASGGKLPHTGCLCRPKRLRHLFNIQIKTEAALSAASIFCGGFRPFLLHGAAMPAQRSVLAGCGGVLYGRFAHPVKYGGNCCRVFNKRGQGWWKTIPPALCRFAVNAIFYEPYPPCPTLLKQLRRRGWGRRCFFR